MKKRFVLTGVLSLFLACLIAASSYLAFAVWENKNANRNNLIAIGNAKILMDKDNDEDSRYFNAALRPSAFSPKNYEEALRLAQEDKANGGETIADSQITLSRNTSRRAKYTLTLSDAAYTNAEVARSAVKITCYKQTVGGWVETVWNNTSFSAAPSITGHLGKESVTFHLFMSVDNAFVAGNEFKFDVEASGCMIANWVAPSKSGSEIKGISVTTAGYEWVKYTYEFATPSKAPREGTTLLSVTSPGIIDAFALRTYAGAPDGNLILGKWFLLNMYIEEYICDSNSTDDSLKFHVMGSSDIGYADLNHNYEIHCFDSDGIEIEDISPQNLKGKWITTAVKIDKTPTETSKGLSFSFFIRRTGKIYYESFAYVTDRDMQKMYTMKPSVSA